MNFPTKAATTVTAILALGLYAGCSGAGNDQQFVGYVEAEWRYVAAPQSGWVIDSPITEGENISAGQVLVVLDDEQQQAQLDEAAGRASQAKAQAEDISNGARPSEIRALEAQLGQAEASLARAENERERIIPLVKKGIESASRGDQVEANYKIAKAAVTAAKEAINIATMAGREQARIAAASGHQAAQAAAKQARWRLDQRSVRSLIEGRVEEIFHHPGEFVAAGVPLVALLPNDGLKARFYVPQDRLTGIQRGQTVTVNADGAESAVSAVISHIADTAEFTPPVIYSAESRGKLVFLVEASLPVGNQLKAGMPVDITL
ncbi:MAG: HlyD family efflux transporter periplasmic adaptor subunit [Gammaproteobacteria bacterium]|nr:HlyD family efflux transporter periplasmic adaptor subunit [Gammaproteobacteria bacterium]